MPELLALLTRGFVLGFSIAAPIGPTGATAIRRGISSGAWAAFWVGMGAAVTDFAYIAATYAGLTPLLERIPGLTIILYAGGAIMLGRLALGAIREALAGTGSPLTAGAAAGSEPAGGDTWYAMLLLGITITLVNPATISYWLSVGGAFVAANLVDRALPVSVATMLAIFLGSAFWFSILAVIVGVARARIERLPWLFRAVGLGSGLILLAFAIAFAARLVAEIT
jgi:threonine/homoserine/homoserine lactone efflux protein